MKVLLRSDVRGLGRRGDIVDVKNGYARNFLLPSGAALPASDSSESQATLMRKARDILDWKPRWHIEQAIDRIVEWHKAREQGADMRQATLRQIEQYSSFGQ